MDPYVTGSIINAGASLAGGILGYAAQRKANQTNLELFEREKQFSRENWYRQAGYNDPSAQIARLRRAGLSPSLAANIPAEQGQVVSATPMQPEDSLAKGISSSISNLADLPHAAYKSAVEELDIERKQHENLQLGISSAFALDREILRLEQARAELANTRQDTAKKSAEISDINERLRLLKEERADMHDLTRSKISLLESQTEEQKHATIRLDKETEQRIKSMSVSDACNLLVSRSQANLNAQQARVAANTATEIATLLPGKWRQQFDFNKLQNDRALMSRLSVKGQELSNRLANMDEQQRQVALEAAVYELMINQQSGDAPVSWLLRNVLGVSSKDALSLLGMFGLGKGVSKAVKGNSVGVFEHNEVPSVPRGVPAPERIKKRFGLK